MKKKKKKRDYLSNVVTFRVTKSEYTKLKAMCKMYAEGRMSEWVRHCITEYTPKVLNKKGA